MFENLTDKIESAFSFFNKITRLDEKQADEGLRKIRQALLESDVALSVTKKFIEDVKPKIIGQEVLKSVTPGQMIIKIVNDELIKVLGSEKSELNLGNVPPIKILVVGLQGSGKTTSTAKLAHFLQKKLSKKVLMTSLDIYRPAAQQQLQVLGNDNDIKTLPIVEGQLPVEISKRALNAVSLSGEDVVIFDTAGRTQIDQQMMMELKQLENEIQPHEIVLVADSLTGQDAVNIAQEFQKTVNLSSIILTRIDGDGKGGAALSMKAVTGCPIKFLATGEKIDQLEAFHPDRIANRILGMGDVVSLVEKVAEDLEQEKIEKIEEDIKKGSFTFDTYLQQIRQMKKVGGMSGVLSMMPGVSKMKKQIDESNLDESLLNKQEAIILSMTQKERDNPKIIGGSRKKRIANGSGTDISMVNKLLKQHKMMTNVMKKMSKGGRGALQGLDGIPPDLLNNLK
ncbi:signal recognition particle protein [Candidatus Pelagibacter sp. HIMB1517]|jgi:signal recognition particle subunit SRP54|uniref:signal recognition particle protein n=1 Tax=Candidatus Pelagibacter sp. HIMB1517 TaxID=3413341 RepID=UPI003127AC31